MLEEQIRLFIDAGYTLQVFKHHSGGYKASLTHRRGNLHALGSSIGEVLARLDHHIRKEKKAP